MPVCRGGGAIHAVSYRVRNDRDGAPPRYRAIRFALGDAHMSLLERLDQDLKDAMRARDRLRSDTIRQVKAAATNAEIAQNAALTDSQVEELIGKLVRQHHESIEVFTKGNRPELAAKEQTELEILAAYLPKQLSREEILGIVRAAAAEAGATGPGDRGKVMPMVKGRTDGRIVGEVVGEVLESLSGS